VGNGLRQARSHSRRRFRSWSRVPIGGAAFNKEFGRPNLAGYFRAYEQRFAGEMRGYHKPIMLAGGLGNISAKHSMKHALTPSSVFVQLGGPGFLIGSGWWGSIFHDVGLESRSARLRFRAARQLRRCSAAARK
jgi:phosphoribosylformylglycinamidine (FGAM) synthase-like enzyme